MHTARAFWLFVIMIALGILAAGCSGTPVGGTSVWIDAPLPGGQVNPGDEVIIQTHSYSSSGIVEIELLVDGEPFSRHAADPAGGDLVTLTQKWIATSPGMHSLQVTAYSRSGAPSSPAAVVIEVLGEEVVLNVPQAQDTIQVPTNTPTTPATATPTLTSTATPTLTSTMTPTLTSTMTPTLTSTATPTLTSTITPTISVSSPTPTATATPVLPPSINTFTVDSYSIKAGECTNLRWLVQHADSVTLNGSLVGSSGSRQVCPQQTTSYTLWAVSPGGVRYQTLTVRVFIPPPADTSAPFIYNLAVNPGTIFDNPSCGADKTLVTTNVGDSGSGVRRVDIYFRVVKPPAQGKVVQNGELASSSMNGSESQGYYWYLDSAELARSLSLWGGSTVQYYLVAVDNTGNSTQSPTYTFRTEICIY